MLFEDPIIKALLLISYMQFNNSDCMRTHNCPGGGNKTYQVLGKITSLQGQSYQEIPMLKPMFINSLAPGRCGSNLKKTIFKLITE